MTARLDAPTSGTVDPMPIHLGESGTTLHQAIDVGSFDSLISKRMDAVSHDESDIRTITGSRR